MLTSLVHRNLLKLKHKYRDILAYNFKQLLEILDQGQIYTMHCNPWFTAVGVCTITYVQWKDDGKMIDNFAEYKR